MEIPRPGTTFHMELQSLMLFGVPLASGNLAVSSECPRTGQLRALFNDTPPSPELKNPTIVLTITVSRSLFTVFLRTFHLANLNLHLNACGRT